MQTNIPESIDTELTGNMEDSRGSLDETTTVDKFIYLKIKGNEEKVKLNYNAHILSELIKNIIISDKSTTEIELNLDNLDIVKYIIKYLNYHNGKVPASIPKPIRSIKIIDLVEDEWDANFINDMDKDTIVKIILASNYLVVDSLLHLGCAKIATLIKGKSPDEVNQILGE